jgi:hypothetical protein
MKELIIIIIYYLKLYLHTVFYGSREGTSDFRLQTSDFRLQTSDFRLQTSDFRLQTSDFRLQTLVPSFANSHIASAKLANI